MIMYNISWQMQFMESIFTRYFDDYYIINYDEH